MAQRLQFRRGTAALATSNNVTLGDGELGYETDTGQFKIGDGVTEWNVLPYAGGGSGGGSGIGIGGIYWWATLTGGAPTGAFKCDGSLKNIADYPSLYAIIGTENGGDGVTTFGLPLKDGIVYTNETSGEVEVDTNGVWVIQAESVESTSADFTGFYNATEMPTYGEVLEDGELFLDGTKSFVSSDNRSPVVDVVDFFASKYSVDGITVDESRSKWPGQRGTYGFFGEYTNQVDNSAWISVNGGILGSEGGWNTITESTLNVSTALAQTISATSGTLYVECLFKKGSSDSIHLSSPTNTVFHQVNYNFTTGVVSNPSGTLIDYGADIIEDKRIVRLWMIYTLLGSTDVQVIINGSTSGANTYFKDYMAVPLAYRVPYTAGTHQPAKLQYDLDWAISDEWTIQGWFNASQNQGVSQIIVDTRDESGSPNGIYLTVGTTGLLTITSDYNGNSGTSYTGSAITPNVNLYVRVIWEASQLRIYLNGVLDITYTSDASFCSPINASKLLAFGTLRRLNGDNPLNGYMQDWTIQPGIDTTTTHYDNGLPYYDPNKIVGKNGSWSIDEMGNIAGLPQVSGIIVEDYELDGQRVTKWDTGRMEISGWGGTGANPVVITYAEPFMEAGLDSSTAITIGTYTGSARWASYSTPTTTGFEIYRYTFGGTAATSATTWVAIGRWK